MDRRNSYGAIPTALAYSKINGNTENRKLILKCQNAYLATEMDKWIHSDRENGWKKSKEKNFADPSRQKSAQSAKYSRRYSTLKFEHFRHDLSSDFWPNLTQDFVPFWQVIWSKIMGY